MKGTVLLVCVLFAISCVFGSNLWGSFPGTDTNKIDALQKGVALAKQLFPTHPCLAEFFGEFDPAATAGGWAAFLCSYWNPNRAATTIIYTDDCYFRNLTTEFDLLVEINAIHNVFPNITTESYNLVTSLLVKGIALVGGWSQAIQTSLITDLNKVGQQIVPTAGVNKTCRASNYFIDWENPTTSSINVLVGEQVEWDWADPARHSVNLVNTTAGNFFFAGFGTNDKTVTSGTACVAANATFPDGGTPCNLISTNEAFKVAKIFNAAGTYFFNCRVHAGMTSKIVVTSAPIVTSDSRTSSASGGGDGGSSASALFSWISFLF